MQVGPIKYSKKEEKIFFKAGILGLLLGLPTAIMLNYSLGFPTLSKQAPTDFYSWVLYLSSWLVSVGILWFAVTAILNFSYYKKEQLLNSWRDVGRIIWILFIFFPVMFTYVILIFSAMFVPLNYATPWLSPIRQYWLGFLLFFPFVFLFFVIVLPDQKPRKLLVRYWRIASRRTPMPRPSLAKVVPILLIFGWLVAVFMPLPENFSTHLVIIGGGLAILAYLMLQRSRERRR